MNIYDFTDNPKTALRAVLCGYKVWFGNGKRWKVISSHSPLKLNSFKKNTFRVKYTYLPRLPLLWFWDQDQELKQITLGYQIRKAQGKKADLLRKALQKLKAGAKVIRVAEHLFIPEGYVLVEGKEVLCYRLSPFQIISSDVI
jgi:hypothetical protein